MSEFLPFIYCIISFPQFAIASCGFIVSVVGFRSWINNATVIVFWPAASGLPDLQAEHILNTLRKPRKHGVVEKNIQSREKQSSNDNRDNHLDCRIYITVRPPAFQNTSCLCEKLSHRIIFCLRFLKIQKLYPDTIINIPYLPEKKKPSEFLLLQRLCINL